MRTFAEVACGPRPHLRTGAPCISSVQTGLFGSLPLAEGFFDNLVVVASFMFSPLVTISREAPWSFGINHYNHIRSKKPEVNQTLFAEGLPRVFAYHSHVVPKRMAYNEVKPVLFDVQPVLWLAQFVPTKRFSAK